MQTTEPADSGGEVGGLDSVPHHGHVLKGLHVVSGPLVGQDSSTKIDTSFRFLFIFFVTEESWLYYSIISRQAGRLRGRVDGGIAVAVGCLAFCASFLRGTNTTEIFQTWPCVKIRGRYTLWLICFLFLGWALVRQRNVWEVITRSFRFICGAYYHACLDYSRTIMSDSLTGELRWVRKGQRDWGWFMTHNAHIQHTTYLLNIYRVYVMFCNIHSIARK